VVETWRNQLAVLAVLALPACGNSPPPQLPTTSVRDRAACHVGLVPLVVDDTARSERVRALYVQMDTLMLEAKRAQAEQLLLLADPNATRTDDDKRARFAQFQALERRALERYIGLQLELRRLTTPAEFARLAKIK
jgi:hypothetical protein